MFSPTKRADSFRNPNGVYMKLMNFRRLDPEYTKEGKKGLSRGAHGEEEVWAEFADDPARCSQVAEAIIASVDDPEVGPPNGGAEVEDEVAEAAEGRLLTRKHFVRERKPALVANKKRQAMKRLGRLACEACGFDFSVRYGKRGDGLIECHHTKPVSTLAEGHKTKLDDLALVCANCHRVIHRTKPWLSIEDVRAILGSHA